MTKLNQILSGTAVGLALIAGSGSAVLAHDRDDYGYSRDRDCDRDYDGDRDRDCDRDRDYYRHSRYDRDYYRDNHYRYDRYRYRHHHRRYVPFDRIYFEIGRHHYRHYGEPFWYHGSYVVRCYDPYGRIVFVRVDPYTGAWLGVSFRL